MSVPESRVRKSNRQHVPNPIYQQGITQLKNENTTRIKRKNNKNNDESNMSFEDEKNSQINYEQSMNLSQGGPRDQYLPCRLPNGNQIRVRFVMENKKEEKKKEREREREKEREVVIPPPAPVKQTTQHSQTLKKPPTTNLLNLFIQAIDNVDVAEQPSSQMNPVSRSVPVPVQKQKPIPMKPKRSRVQEQDFIKKVVYQDGKMKIIHSQLNQLEYPVDWQQDKMVAEESPHIQELRKKLENCKVLKNISILTAS